MTSFIFDNPPFLSCHGSTIVKDTDGSYIVAWFAGMREGLPDTAIWWCKSKDGHWTRPAIAAKVSPLAHWNPVLHLDDKGVKMYFKVGRWVDYWDTWKCRLVEGAWTKPVIMKAKNAVLDGVPGKITPGPVRGKIVKLCDGTLLAPSSVERYASAIHTPTNVIWSSVVHRSTDGGKHWSTKPIPFPRQESQLGGIIQPSIWEVGSGCATALIRSTTGYLWRSETFDDGMTWTEAKATNIPNPNSAIDVVTLDNQLLAMAYNPVTGNWAKRTPLTIAFSGLDGEVFHCPVNVEDNPIYSFGYPYMIEIPGGIAMTYTWRRKRIAFVEMQVQYSFSQDPENWSFYRNLKVTTAVAPSPSTYDFGGDE